MIANESGARTRSLPLRLPRRLALSRVAPYAVTVAAIVIVTIPAWSNSIRFYDDWWLANDVHQFGYGSAFDSLYAQWHFYRIGYTVLLGLVYVGPLWCAKLVGILLHAASSCFAYWIWRRLGGSHVSALALAGSFVFFPFALEATAWPAVVTAYALAAALGAAGRPCARDTAFALVATRRRLRDRDRTAVRGAIRGDRAAAAPDARRQPWTPRGRRGCGAAVGFALTTTLLLLSQSSDRFVGPNRATVANVFNHVDYIWTHLRLAMPLGRLLEHRRLRRRLGNRRRRCSGRRGARLVAGGPSRSHAKSPKHGAKSASMGWARSPPGCSPSRRSSPLVIPGSPRV